MSVLVIAKFYGDQTQFQNAVSDRADEFRDWSDLSQKQGAIHHRFGLSPDGQSVIVVDEWESEEDFESFFSNPKLQQFIAGIGADMSRPPEITFAKAMESPDQF
jgi:quinol monooxygenase YgiN